MDYEYLSTGELIHIKDEKFKALTDTLNSDQYNLFTDALELEHLITIREKCL